MSTSIPAALQPAFNPLLTRHILLVREQRVMLDAELATLYGVQTKVLVQAVKRHAERFPADFMFQLSAEEFAHLRSQAVTSSSNDAGTTSGYGGRRYAPYAFTEQGVAMLSSVLNSPRSIAINIEIMRAFVQMRALASTHLDLAERLGELEEKTERLALQHDTFSRNTRAQLKQVFDALRELMTPPDPPKQHKQPIGFVPPQEKKGQSASNKTPPKVLRKRT